MIRTNRARAYKYLNKKNKIIGILSITEMVIYFVVPLMFTSVALSSTKANPALFVLIFLIQSLFYFLVYQLIFKKSYLILMFLREKLGLSRKHYKNWRSHE